MEPLGAKVKGGPERPDSLGCRMTTTEVICSFQKAKGSREPEMVVRACFSREADGCPRTVCRSVGYLPPPGGLLGRGASLSPWTTPQNWSHLLGSLESGCHLIPLEASCRVGGSGRGGEQAAGRGLLCAELTSLHAPDGGLASLPELKAELVHLGGSWEGRRGGERRIKEPFDSSQEHSCRGPG